MMSMYLFAKYKLLSKNINDDWEVVTDKESVT